MNACVAGAPGNNDSDGSAGGAGGNIICPSGKTGCDGLCVDTQTDNANCGGCANVCSAVSPSTARCTAGRCLTTLVVSDNTNVGLAVDCNSVYWTNNGGSIGNGTVMRVPLAGGTPTTLASGQNGPSGIAVDASSVYWIDQAGLNTSSVMKMPLGGGTPTTLASGYSYGASIVVDATSVYWIDLGPRGFGGFNQKVAKSVVQMPLGGGTPTALASGLAEPTTIAVDATYVYWTTSDLMKVPLAGGTPTTLASGAGANDIAVDATSVYWIGSDAVMKVALSGGTPTTLASDQSYPSEIAVDASNIYWINSGTYDGNYFVDGTVMKMPLAGGVPTTLVSGLSEAYKIAIDGTSVYWIAGVPGESAVMKLTPK